MKHYFTYLLFLISFLLFSQKKSTLEYQRPFVVFQNCEDASDMEQCYDTQLSAFFADKLNILETKTKLFSQSKKDTLVINCYINYNEAGRVIRDFSNIYFPFKNFKEEAKEIIKSIPQVQPILDKYGNAVIDGVGSSYGFLLDRINEKIIPIPDYKPTEMPISVIEEVPIYKGCNKDLNNEEMRKCMSGKVAEIIVDNFNSKLAGDLGLSSGYIKILVAFKVDKKGKVIDIIARAKHKQLEEEAIRIIKKIPKLTRPGYQRGEPVIVAYRIPIVFAVE